VDSAQKIYTIVHTIVIIINHLLRRPLICSLLIGQELSQASACYWLETWYFYTFKAFSGGQIDQAAGKTEKAEGRVCRLQDKQDRLEDE